MKSARHAKILEIINQNSVRTQEELADLLQRDCVQVTQATVSRDIKDLKLIKVHNNDGEMVYAPAGAGKQEDKAVNVGAIFSESVASIDHAVNIVVIKTLTGMAQGIASLIDQMALASVLGSIAGDDTIMIVTRTAEDADKLSHRLKKLRK